jgi:cytochrome P450/pimeloyl-ACP methyl ester carboxylesterase
VDRPPISSLILDTERGPVRAIHAGESGPAVVMCAGLTGSRDDYRQVLPTFAGAGFRAYAYDYQGHYSTEPTAKTVEAAARAAEPAAHTIERHAGDLVAVLASVDDGRPVHLLGHSIGGFVVRAAALARPDLVRSLTLIGCGPAMDDDEHRKSLRRFEAALSTGGPALLWPIISRIIPAADSARRDFWKLRLATMQLPFLCGMLQSLCAEPDRSADVRRLSFPKLFLRGARDKRLWAPDDMAAYAKRADAELAIVEQASHSPMLERPEAVAEPLLRFWTATDRQRAVRTCFEIMRPRAAADPYPLYANLRAAAPVLLIDPPGRVPTVVLTHYADCHRLLNDRGCHSLGETPDLLTPGWHEDRYLRAMLRSFALREGPAHAPLRGALAAQLTPRRSEAFRRDTEEIADRLLDELADRLDGGSTVNLTEVLAVPFASLLTGRLLGIPDAEALRLGRAGAASSMVFEPFITPRQRGEMTAAGAELLAGLDGHRSGLSATVRAHHPGGGDPCLGDLALLFSAAQDSPASLVTLGAKLLLDHPDQADRVRDDPALADACVAEILRLEPPVQIAVRVATEPRRFGDVDVAAGTPLLGIIAAANRDPAYTDDPDRFLIARSVRGPSLSFGAGRHYCPGAALARLQAGVLFPRLLRRFPGLRAAGPARYRSPGTMLRRIDDLPVTLER